MKEIKPIRFDGPLDKGGSTKPWLVSCIAPESNSFEEISCVLKLFSPTHVNDTNCIAKEFICNLLASQFDLMVPDAYLINAFEPDFLESLDSAAKQDLDTRFKGLAFASKLISASILNPEVKSNNYDIHDCALVFAFDCLILNQDRGGYRNKPNLLVDDEGLKLIDHELSLHFMNGEDDHAYNAIMKSYSDHTWPSIYQMHIFYQKLKSYKGNHKANLFDTFEEYLSRLDIKAVEKVLNDLIHHEITIGQKELLIQYLCKLKKESHKFCRILLNLIA